MRYAFTFRNTSPDTAPVAPAHNSAGTLIREKDEEDRISSKHVPCIPSSAIAEPAPDMPEPEITGQNHGERHSEHKAHTKAHKADQKDRAQTAAVSMCWERNSEIPIRSSDRIRRPNTPFLSNSHCSAPFICRTFTTVFFSSFKKSAGVFKAPWCFFSHPCAPERSAVERRRLRRSSKYLVT